MVRSRQPGRDTKILLQLCTNTYNAYNSWGGSSLYGGPQGALPARLVRAPLHRLRARRPVHQPLQRLAEVGAAVRRVGGSRRVPLDFAVNSDLEFRPEILKGYRLVLSVGHDEYWSAPMRDHLEAFIGAGGNVGFFSGNTCFWQVRTEDDGRALVSWKMDFDQDPVYKTGRPSAADRHVEQPPGRAAGEPVDGRQLRLRRLPPLLRASAATAATPSTGPTTGSSPAPA